MKKPGQEDTTFKRFGEKMQNMEKMQSDLNTMKNLKEKGEDLLKKLPSHESGAKDGLKAATRLGSATEIGVAEVGAVEAVGAGTLAVAAAPEIAIGAAVGYTAKLGYDAYRKHESKESRDVKMAKE